MNSDKCFKLEIIAFGTHLDKNHGYTIEEIQNSNLEVRHRIETLTENENPHLTSNSIGDTIIKFSNFWRENKYDLVICLGDRYEMFAALSASIPFEIKTAHIHAGETTLGAIDNIFRHSISLMCEYLFVSTEVYRKRAIEINSKPEHVFNVGALSIDNLENLNFYSISEFKEKFNIDLTKPTILSTFHPETVLLSKNHKYISELINSFNELKERYQIVVTMPNTDTMGDMIRRELINFAKDLDEVKLIESFGVKGYLSCMKYCSFLLGNTSSGFVEASYFPKKVINLGSRQKGRIITENIINCKIKKNSILDSVKEVEKMLLTKKINIYKKGNTSDNIINILKKIYDLK
jgi:GDP/UDP-N,N'-diacetylbacillosamine 2-epimerase (hydrolysing)